MSTLYSRRLALPSVDLQPRLLAAPANAFEAALAFTIGYGVPGYGEEGGEADNPNDPGGLTWRGITLTNFRVWRHDPSALAAQLLQMPEAEIVAFYGCNYFNPICGNQLPASAALSVFDMAVNAGPGASSKILQRSVGFTGLNVDGSIGPMTLGAVAAADPATLLQSLHDEQLASYQQYAGWATFGQGWINRTTARLAAAQAFLPSTTGN